MTSLLDFQSTNKTYYEFYITTYDGLWNKYQGRIWYVSEFEAPSQLLIDAYPNEPEKWCIPEKRRYEVPYAANPIQVYGRTEEAVRKKLQIWLNAFEAEKKRLREANQRAYENGKYIKAKVKE